MRVRPAALLVVLAVAVAMFGLVAFERCRTAASERSSQKQLTAEFAATAVTRRTDAPPVPGHVLGMLTIPRLATTGQAVVEGATVGNLRRGPGHESLSPLPGSGGAVVILGHRRTYGAPFGRLGDLRAGDVVSLRTTAGLFVYRVSRTAQVLGSGSQVLQLPSAAPASGSGSGQSHEALVLATGVDSRGAALQVVVATLDQASAVGRVESSGANGVGAHLRSVPGERIGLLLVVLWAAILAALLFVHRRLRSKLPLPLLVGTGSIGGMWAIYQIYLAVDRLLPGTF